MATFDRGSRIVRLRRRRRLGSGGFGAETSMCDGFPVDRSHVDDEPGRLVDSAFFARHDSALGADDRSVVDSDLRHMSQDNTCQLDVREDGSQRSVEPRLGDGGIDDFLRGHLDDLLNTVSIADSCRSSLKACNGGDYCDKRDEACFHSMGMGVGVSCFAEADQVWSTPDRGSLSVYPAKFLWSARTH